MVQFHPRSISTWSNFTTLAVYLIWCYCFCFQVRILSPSCYLIKNISKNYEKCREEFRMHFDLSHFSPLQAMKMWKQDVLTLLSHFPTLYATKMWQQSHNFHQSKINNTSYIHLHSRYRSAHKWKKRNKNNIGNAAYFALICLTICSDI